MFNNEAPYKRFFSEKEYPIINGLAEGIEYNICNEIITLFLEKRPIIRWYLNSTEQLEMDIDARFVDSLDIHNKICDFFTGLSCLIDDNIFLLDNIIKENLWY